MMQSASRPANIHPRLADAALAYAEKLGWPVAPAHYIRPDGNCSCGKIECPSPGKHPMTANGFKDATTDLDTIRYRWDQSPEANVILPTGDATGLLVLDIDPDHGGDATLAALEAIYGPLPPTVEQITGSGGRHLLFRYPGPEYRNTAGRVGPGIDSRGNGGYVVVAPSNHRSGDLYRWRNGRKPGQIEIAEAPDWLLVRLRKNRSQAPSQPRMSNGDARAYAETALADEVKATATAQEGERNDQLNRSAFALGQLVGADLLDRARVERALTDAAQTTGLTLTEIEPTLRSGLEAGFAEPRQAPDWELRAFSLPISGNGQYKGEPPRPLCRELEPAEAFPIDALGDVLGPAAEGIHERIRSPLAICGQSVVAVATLAVQGHADVRLPTGAQVPISNYYVSVAATGERKTAVDREAMWPIRKREETLRATHEIDLAIYQNDRDVHEKARAGILGQAKGKAATIDSIQADLEALGKPPAPPLTPMLTCPEPTFEGLTRLLSGGQPSMGIFSGEGGQFLGGHGMNQDNRLKTAAAMSGLWDGDPIRRVRQGDGSMVLPGRRVSIHLMVQPGVAAKLFGSRELADQGLPSRILAAAPDPTTGTRFWREPSPGAHTAVKQFGVRVLEILEAPLPMAEGKENELAPRALVLSPEARELWIKFVDHVETHLGPDGELRNISGLANKLPEHAARIASVITLVDDLNRTEVSAEYMERGVTLALYYAAEALRLFEAGQVDHQIAIAQRLLDWLNRRGEDLVSLPDIYQRGLNCIPDQKTARRLVGILEDHGWLAPVEGGAVVSGYRRRDVWRIVNATG